MSAQLTEQLRRILQDGQCHSGQQLAEQLQVSRTAIWKQIEKLQHKGLKIERIRGTGYRLMNGLHPLNVADLTFDGLNACQIQLFDSIDSTNSYLMQHSSQLPLPFVCLAEEQSAGKGRRGRTWISPYASHIYCSVLWSFPLSLAQLSGVSLCVGIAIVQALTQLGFDGLQLKWPNDIRVAGKKLAGILIEITGEADGPTQLVIGFGINVYDNTENEKIDQPWVNLQSLTSKRVDRNQITRTVLQSLFRWLHDYPTLDKQTMVQHWNQYDEFYQQAVTLIQGERRIHGIACGIDEQGALLLRQADGELKAVVAGEISLRAAE